MTKQNFDPVLLLVAELNLPQKSISTVLDLLGEGNTVPFIARYRKEATGDLDEVQIRAIEERNSYLCELEDRRNTILKSIESQGKLTEELRGKVLACTMKNTLEDLYLPYKPKRRTRAMIAREKGLEPLAEKMLQQGMAGSPEDDAKAFVDEEKGAKDAEEALAGARDIVAEAVAENAELRTMIRDTFMKDGVVVSRCAKGKESEAVKYKDYYEFSERVAKIPSHRYLAIKRGYAEGLLNLTVEIPEGGNIPDAERMMGLQPSSPYATQMKMAIEDAFKRMMLPSIETDTSVDLKMQADRGAVEVFAANLRNILLASPLGERGVIGVDPGLRTGCKCAVLDNTGTFIENMTFNLVKGSYAEEQAAHDILAFVKKYNPFAIAIGNGTGGRETEAFIKKTLANASIKDVIVVMVNEAGVSVYSASDIAREEFPDLDLTIRGAISIARRLQDPLSELVKIDPKAIGVGQYQHDVYQPLLQQKLKDVVESCVNYVGVELNTASEALLLYVSGIGPAVAKKIIKYREEHGVFHSRNELLKVSGLGGRTYQQAAGFLRIREGDNPLDRSAVHPEQYHVVEEIVKKCGETLQSIIGNEKVIDAIDIHEHISEEVGELTLRDIIAELRKPGRDPRSTFERPQFREGVNDMKDLHEGMALEGIVTNVTAFGAFVDIGVHQDGLVHISQLSDTYVKDPQDAVKTGDKINVRVLEVDIPRKRISLSARSKENAPRKEKKKEKPQKKQFGNNPFAAL
jgi:protein Tex